MKPETFEGTNVGELLITAIQRGLRHGDITAALPVNRPEVFFVIAAGYLLGLRELWMNPIASADDHLYQVNDVDVKLLAVDPASFGDRA